MLQPSTWLVVAGLVTWVASGVPAGLAIANGRISVTAATAWLIAFAAFGAAFTLGTFVCSTRTRLERVLVLVQSVAGVVMLSIAGEGFAGATLVVAASQLSGLVPGWVAALWMTAHTAALFAVFWSVAGLFMGITGAGAYLGFQLFAFATTTLVMRERMSRDELARANAELHATQALLSENIRVAERLRISRDLHDTLGHHLTALSLQLDVASRLSAGAAAPQAASAAQHISEAHAITKLLLGDVRDVVSRLRETSRFDLGAAVRTLAQAAAQPQVHVAVADDLFVDDPLQAHAMLRCVQEVITNAMRHAHARNLWISIERRDDGIVLTARDDGRGVDTLTSGNGLRGMRERFEELSGRVDFSSRPGAGFEVQAFVPK